MRVGLHVTSGECLNSLTRTCVINNTKKKIWSQIRKQLSPCKSAAAGFPFLFVCFAFLFDCSNQIGLSSRPCGAPDSCSIQGLREKVNLANATSFRTRKHGQRRVQTGSTNTLPLCRPIFSAFSPVSWQQIWLKRSPGDVRRRIIVSVKHRPLGCRPPHTPSPHCIPSSGSESCLS